MTAVEVDGHEITVTPSGRSVLLELADNGHVEAINFHPAARERLISGGLIKMVPGGYRRVGLTLRGVMAVEHLRGGSS